MDKPQPKHKRTDRKPPPSPNKYNICIPQIEKVIIDTINKRKENENTPIINIINIPNKCT